MTHSYLQLRPQLFAQQFYKCEAADYVRYRLGGKYHKEDTIATILNAAVKRSGRSDLNILDIGCGFKSYLYPSTQFAQYIGIDFSRELLTCHSLYGSKRARFIERDLLGFDFMTIGYDFVLGVLVLNYIKNPKHLLQRVRRKGAFFFFAVPNPTYDKKHAVIDGNGDVTHCLSGITLKYHHHTIQTIINAVEDPIWLRIVYPHFQRPKTTSPYVCISGKW